MRRALTTLLAMSMSTAALAQAAAPLCVIDPAQMPMSWRPTAEIAADLSSEPWSPREAVDVQASIAFGVVEMLDYFEKHPAAAPDMWEDSVGALIEVSYSTTNAPSLNAALHASAAQNLGLLMAAYLGEPGDDAACEDFEEVMPLAMYAERFHGATDARAAHMIAAANASLADCGSLSAAIGMPFPAILADPAITGEQVFDLVIWSLLFIEAELIEGFEVSAEMAEFSPALWTFLQTYEIKDAAAYEDGAYDDAFIEDAYLATHIAYIPTGNHRYPLYIEDMPWLYDFHRENFYAMLEMGELDLVAEVVDSLRQYGCTEENDIQVRDGTRYLLDVWHEGGESWMAYREPGETDSSVDAYDLIHKTWTGVLGVRPRQIEAPAEGTYGGLVRKWMPAPR
jgi:hypothetical protein